MIGFSQLLNVSFNKTIVDDIPLSRHDVALLLPDIIWDMVSPAPQIQSFFRQPEKWHHNIFLLLGSWREHQHKGCNIRCTGKIQATVTVTATQRLNWNRRISPVIDVIGYPADCS